MPQLPVYADILDNYLVREKDKLIEWIDGDHNGYAAAMVLEFLAPLWEQVGYGYKVDELRQRIKNTEQELPL